MIKCEVCGKPLEIITPTHLKLHNLTTKGYRKLFPEALFWSKEMIQKREGYKHSGDTIKKISEGKMGPKNPMYGKEPWNKKDKSPVICETCGKVFEVQPYRVKKARFCSIECLNEWRKGRHFSPETEFKKNDPRLIGNKSRVGYDPWNKGKRLPPWLKNVIRISVIESMKDVPYEKLAYWKGKKNPRHGEWVSEHMWGENAPNWKGGLSFEPYGPEFNNGLKEEIRERDNHLCQLCGKTQEENGRRLDVHHIDYDKKNCDLSNLISLCWGCNTKTNFNREFWKVILKGMVKKVEGCLPA